MTNRKPKPPIDRAAEAAQEVLTEAGRPTGSLTASTAPAPAADLMPTAENDPPLFFTPGSGIGSSDVLEIALMYLMQLTATPVSVNKGALRTIAMEAHRIGMLSDSAQRFMRPAPTTAH